MGTDVPLYTLPFPFLIPKIYQFVITDGVGPFTELRLLPKLKELPTKKIKGPGVSGNVLLVVSYRRTLVLDKFEFYVLVIDESRQWFLSILCRRESSGPSTIVTLTKKPTLSTNRLSFSLHGLVNTQPKSFCRWAEGKWGGRRGRDISL